MTFGDGASPVGDADKGSNLSKPHDLLALLGGFAREHGVPLTAEDIVPRFLADAGLRLGSALSDSALIHGTRTEQQFEALVLSLGRYRLLKAEDLGRLHSNIACRAPDYRIVLEDGEQWLVEVKNVRGDDPARQVARLSAAYLASLNAYCDLVRVPLRIAHYWSRWKIWTLVDPRQFLTASGGARIDMMAAFAANELSRLGDVIFCTEPPIRLLVEANSESPRERTAATRPTGIRLFVGGKEITELRSQQLAWILMLYGEWAADGPHAVTEDGHLTGIEFIVAPEEVPEEDEPALMGRAIGQASRVFARYFAEDTTAGDAVIQLRGQAKPEWFEPIANWDFKTAQLPLWILRLQPRGHTGASPGAD